MMNNHDDTYWQDPYLARERREEARQEFLRDDKRPTFEVISDGVRRSRGLANSLENLAAAFAATGNDRVAEKLDNIAEELIHLVAEIKSSHSREMNHHFQESQRMLGLTFSAALTVGDREHKAATQIAKLESQVGASD